MNRLVTVLAAGVLSLVALACGGGDHDSHGDSDAEPTRTIEVTMKEFAYEPGSVSVKAGETVKFVFRNVGSILHDAFIGDEDAQAEHEQEMRSGKMHKDHGAVKVIPGETGEIVHTFEEPGETYIGCHETGHYGAGMKMTVTVT